MKTMYPKIIKTCIYLLATFSIFGCSNMLDITPSNSVTKKGMFTNNKDPYAIKTGLYHTMQGLVEQRFVLGELRGDLVSPARGAKGNVDILEFLEHNVTPNNKYLDWSGFYTLINQCNDALVSIPKTLLTNPPTNSLDSFRYDNCVSEVLWLRAWAYFTLVENWGDVPFYTKPVFNVDSIQALPAVSEDTILNQLERDLVWVTSTGNPSRIGANWAWTPTVNKFWNHENVNMCAVVALLGEIYMYRNKYKEAWTQSCYLRILNSQPTVSPTVNYRMQEDWHSSFNIGGSCLTNGIDWFNVEFRYANEEFNSSWTEQGLILAFDCEVYGNGGGIFKQKHTLGYFTNNRPEEGGLYYVKPSNSSIDLFKNNLDVYRGEGASYVIDNNTTLQTQDTLIWKYCGSSVSFAQNTRNVISIQRRQPFVSYGNINIVRTSDLYLEASECANRLGYTSVAFDNVSQNKARVNVLVNFQSNATVEQIEDAIMDERALELAYEGIRWYDLVRISKRRNDPGYLINKVIQNEPAATREILRARLQGQAKNWWKLPYSAKALQLNSHLTNSNR